MRERERERERVGSTHGWLAVTPTTYTLLGKLLLLLHIVMDQLLEDLGAFDALEEWILLSHTSWS